jgi:thymidylate synthase
VQPMLFEALYYPDRLRVVNASGDVGVVTLWSLVDSVSQVLQGANVDLSPATSRVAVIANLYGNGLPQMLRNLLWNPQIRYIVVLGQNLSGSREWLLKFFEFGLEEVEFLGSRAYRIRGTNRTIDGEVKPEDFAQRILFVPFGDIGDPNTSEGVRGFLQTLPPAQLCTVTRVSPPPIKEPEVAWFPSEPGSHTITRPTPIEAWAELVFRLVRFGLRTKVAKHTSNGEPTEEDRVELQNVKVIVQQPTEEPDEELRKYGFVLQEFKEYQRRILVASKPADLGYTYGNRLRGYFSNHGELIDTLEVAATRLRAEPESRHAYISLWDSSRDLPEGTDCPCFVTAFFRRFEGKLTMTATFRSHNAMDAWPKNVYGLIAVQRFVAERAGMEAGPITVISHSIGIDIPSLERAKRVADSKTSDDVRDKVTGKLGPRFDPNGAFAVTIDKAASELVVEHTFQGVVLRQYRGKSAEEIERQLTRDVALSEISHALYLGREIARKEIQMKSERSKAEKREA